MNEPEEILELTENDAGNEATPVSETETAFEESELMADAVAEEGASVQTPTEEETPPPPLPSREDLCMEIDRLRTELEETKSLHARMADELGEFHALFPDVNTTSIPESIWEQVKNGVPLAASYALYEKKCELRRQHAEEINLRNAKHSPGAAGKNTPAEYFSPDEVRRMSQSEVSRNYQKILESMKKWNT